MLWVATAYGLSRFDGVHFFNFNAGKDSNAFINNSILDLCEDKAGNIWGATGSGIFCYKVLNNVFENYIPPTYDFARGIKNIICDRSGNIWASSEWNILKLNKGKNAFEQIGPLTNNYDSLGAYSVRQNGLVEDPSGTGLWFATRRGLHFYNIGQDKFYNYKNSPGDSLFTSHSVAALSLSKTGNIWFFDNVTKDIISFHPKTHQILQRINVNAEMPKANASTLFEDSNHLLWFSTWGNKMAVIDYRNHNFTSIAYKRDNPLSIAGDFFWDAWEDEDNTIWLGTSGGLSKCNYLKNAYSIIPIVEKVPEFKNSKLGAFNIDIRDNSWWLTSDVDYNIIHYYQESGKYDFFDVSKAIKNSKGQRPGPVYGIKFIDNLPYVCTHSGVWKINEATKQITPFEKMFRGLPAIQYYYFEEHGDDVWFNSTEGFIKWNRKLDQSILVKSAIDSFPDGQREVYSALHFDKTGRPWFVPAFGWLAYIDNNNKVVSKYYVKNKEKELAGFITALTDDKQGNLWLVASGIGLYKYNIAKEEMTLYDQSFGVQGDIGVAITDQDDRLWIAARNKFSIFNAASNSIKYYYLPLYDNSAGYYNSFQMDSLGSILVTIPGDIVKFMPERMDLKPVLDTPLIGAIRISGNERLINSEAILKLEPTQNSLEFRFGSLINNEIFPYVFEYILEGFDKKWIAADATATALYSNLAPGSYVFKVRAIAKDKNWQTPDRIIEVVIRTPFYRTWWFFMSMAGLLLAGLVYFYRFKIDKQRQIFTLESKADSLEKEKTMIQYESLKQQLNPHFLFNSLTSLRSLIKTDSKTAAWFLDGLSKVYRYVLRSADQELVRVSEEVAFVTTFAELQKVRFGEGFQVNFSIADAAAEKQIAPVVLQNLLENAIKHNTTSIDSPLVIDIFDAEDYLHVRNNLQRYRIVETSNQQGLQSLRKLYGFYTEKAVLVNETEQHFTVSVPLL